ncbi:MAG TPA: hypothetical protein VFU84_02305, partial [Gaiellaceae bacterium]|nr:hypothetical protein [Gaiellaceae bacterium]
MADRGPTNGEIADRLTLFAALLELAETSPFAIRAYTRAADVIRASPASVSELVRAGRVRELRGIGRGIESKLRELVETGEIAELRALEEELEPALVAYGRTLGLTPSRTLAIARHLDVHTVGSFEEAVRAGRLREVPGVGPVTEAKIVASLAREPAAPRGLTINRSRALAQEIADALGGDVAGPARRYAELSHELAVVVASVDPGSILARFADLPQIVVVLERAERRAVGLTVDGVPVVLVVSTPSAYGTELVRATGSADYVAALGALPEAATEDELFHRLGLPYCPPELRELPGEGAPPDLVELTHIRGDLHCHTTWSDGRATVHEMALAAMRLGYEYLAICDHSPNVRVVPGLDADQLLHQAEEIA